MLYIARASVRAWVEETQGRWLRWKGEFVIGGLVIPLSSIGFRSNMKTFEFAIVDRDGKGRTCRYKHLESVLKRIKKEIGLNKSFKLTCEKPRITISISGGNIAHLSARKLTVWLD